MIAQLLDRSVRLARNPQPRSRFFESLACTRQALCGKRCAASVARQALRGMRCAASVARHALRGKRCAACAARQALRGMRCAASAARQALRGMHCCASDHLLTCALPRHCRSYFPPSGRNRENQTAKCRLTSCSTTPCSTSISRGMPNQWRFPASLLRSHYTYLLPRTRLHMTTRPRCRVHIASRPFASYPTHPIASHPIPSHPYFNPIPPRSRPILNPSPSSPHPIPSHPILTPPDPISILTPSHLHPTFIPTLTPRSSAHTPRTAPTRSSSRSGSSHTNRRHSSFSSTCSIASHALTVRCPRSPDLGLTLA